MTGMNAGSAGDYVSNFLAMMKGEKYTRTLNEYTTKYFLDHILEDYGPSALQKAVAACKMHADYYATLLSFISVCKCSTSISERFCPFLTS